MANKDLFKQAIAEAKSVREAAIANAKEALEETLTPHLKDMLAAKLQEMDNDQIEEEVVNEVEEVKESTEITEKSDKDEKEMEESKEEKKDEAIEENDGFTTVEEAEEDEEPAEDDSEESEDGAEDAIEEPGEEEGEEVEGDEDLKDLSVDQFKDMIRDIIAQEVGGDAPADDMDGGDIEGMGDEAPVEEPGMEDEPEMGGDEEEIDLDELIRELESISEEPTVEEEVEEGKKDEKEMEESADDKKEETVEEDTSVQVNHESDGKDYNINRVADLKEALETIETLKKELNEVNILNAKLLYVNKIFKAQNLSESQKVNVIAAFDKAETVKEVKLVFETVSENIPSGNKKEVVSIKFPLEECPYVSKILVEEARKSLPPDIFAQEFQAEFVDSSNDVFIGVDKVSTINLFDLQRRVDVYAGIDTGLTDDMSVLTVLENSQRKEETPEE